MIQTSGLTKRFGEVVALHPLDLEVERGEIFGYVGPNGAGKTTTLRLLCGLLAPSAGTAKVAGIDIVSQPEKLRSVVGYMPDQLTPYEGMRVWEYLDFFAAAYRMRRRDRRRRVEEVLDWAGIGTLRDYHVETLSHGMRQRLGVARTLVHDPDVLLLDEPASGLDPRARVQMRALMLRLKQLGKTLLIASHILPELACVCDRVGFMQQGKLVACGPLREVQSRVHEHRVFELELLSDPQAAAFELRSMLAPDKRYSIKRIESLVRVEMEGSDEEVAQLLAGLVQKGHRVFSFREVAGDLEQAYLALTAEEAFGQRSYEVP